MIPSQEVSLVQASPNEDTEDHTASSPKHKNNDLSSSTPITTTNAAVDVITNSTSEAPSSPPPPPPPPPPSSSSPVKTVGFLKLFSFVSGLDYLLLSVGTIAAIAHGAALPVFFYFFGALLDGFGNFQNDPVRVASEVSKYATAFVYVGIAILVSSWADVACWMHSAERQTKKMRSAYLEAILRQDIGFFDTDVETGSLVVSVSADTLLVQEAIGEKMGSFIHFIATFVGGFVVGFTAYWKLALVMLAVLPAIALAGGILAYTLTKLTTQGQKAYEQAGSIVEQALTQIRTVFSFVGESKTLSVYSECLKVTVQIGYKGGLAKGLGMGSAYGILFFSWALVLWYAGVLVRKNETTGGKAISAIFSIIIGGMAMGQAMSNITAFGKGKAALQTIMNIIEMQPKMDRKLIDGITLPDVKGDIELCNVAFSYPSRLDVKIFNDFSIQIASGRTVAIVGGSGSGKSTVISLIERYYDPTQGQVLLDGVDVSTLQLKWLRDQIGLVNQEPALFATSIKENILYGKPDASMQEVEQAAKAANAHGYITQLPNSYETQVGERGVQLSGGQKQRIAIARAMLKNPKILLLDEATSALDVASEKVVQEALDRLMVGRTTIVVAHRLSTIRNVDTIAVVQEGKIVEMGNHEELMAKGLDGAYAALVQLQEMAMSTDGHILTPRGSRLNSFGVQSSKSMRASLSFRSSSGRVLSMKHYSGSLRMEDELQKGEDEKGENKEEKRSNSKSLYWRLLKLNAPEWPYAILGIIGSVLAGFLNPVFALIISEMIQFYYDPDFNKMRREVQKYSLIFVGTGCASVGIYVLQHYYFGIVGENLTARVRELMLAAILKNEVGWFDQDENSSAILAARLSTDATNVRGAIGDKVSLLLQNATALLTAIVIGLVVEWRLTLVLLATFPLLVGAAWAETALLKGFNGDLEKAHLRATRVAGEAVGNIRTVAAFNAESKVLQLYTSELSSLERRSFLRGNIAGAGYGIAQFCMFSSYGLALWYGSTLVKNGTSEFGPVLKVFMVMIITAFAVAEALSLTPDIAKGGKALESVFSITDRNTLIDPNSNDGEKLESIKGSIEFRNVEFAYPTRPEVTIFKDFNLRVKAGTSVALVGASGSGKSSVISLIERFYDPLSGFVMIDGKDIKKVHLKSLRRHIGLVQQEPALFAQSIYDNIVYGGEDGATISEADVENAAKAANAHSFISGLPEGYKTMVGERGAQLSGGQKQRVAIARAVLKNPSILLLDEATSALDAESEKIVQEALDGLMEGRTTVIVAHRLSTIRGASIIAIVQDGKIIEKGSHNELMDKPDGPYARLVNLQSHHPTTS